MTTQTRSKLSGWPLGLLLVLILLLVHALRDILVPFALAAGAVYILNPFVRFVQKWTRAPRAAVAALLYFLLIAAAASAAWKTGPRFYSALMKFSTNVPVNTHLVVVRVLGGERVNVLGIQLDAVHVSNQLAGYLQGGLPQPQALKIGGLAVGAGFTVVLFLVLLFYFLVQGPELARGLLRLVPPEYRPTVGAFAGKAHPILTRYFEGLFIIVVFTALVVSIGMRVLFHINHAFLLGMAAGILELLPVLGPTIAAFLVFGSLALSGGTVWNLVALGVFWFCVRQTIDQIVGPIVLGRAVRLPPVVVIFAFLAGGALLGLLGLLLAIPAAALFKLLLDTYYALPVE
ncbi:MAG TPA: AI-2E family transporter [Verrucomicrobiae bacterium]|nr:AI-2E family transporter [Verrucomicrobiae bacterium]